jgi:hypothetical protein
MTRKNYERAATLIQSAHEIARDETERQCARALDFARTVLAEMEGE